MTYLEPISVRINVTRIEKARLYAGKNGKYLDLILLPKREQDQYGNDYMVTQSVSKEERQSGVKGPILGDAKVLRKAPQPVARTPKPAPPPMTQEEDDVPF